MWMRLDRPCHTKRSLRLECVAYVLPGAVAVLSRLGDVEEGKV
jgi:hypothetical protein